MEQRQGKLGKDEAKAAMEPVCLAAPESQRSINIFDVKPMVLKVCFPDQQQWHH